MATKKATIKRKISAIEFSKEQMRKAINSKGRDIKKNAAFSTYGEEIRQIVSGDTVEDLGGITITKNGTTNPGTNKGYSSVEVSVSGNVQPYGETVTKNGTISASGDIDGYSSITVQVAGGKETDPDKIRKNAHGLGKKTITKNGVYRAEDDGYKGYSEVNVQVVKKGDKEDTGKTYTVTFKNKDGTTLQTVENVPFGGAAAYTGEEPTLESMDKIGYWNGWKPIPYDIRKDTICTALYGDFNCGYKDPNEIKDNWDTICSNRGSKYKVGQWRLLCFGETEYEYTPDDMVDTRNIDDNPNVYDHFPMFISDGGLLSYYSDETPHHLIRRYGMVRMMKVAEGEDGSTSTWITMDCPNFRVNYRGETEWYGNSAGSSQTWSKLKVDNGAYERMPVRDFLNNYFIKAMPKCLQNAILEVTKYSSGNVYSDVDTEHTGQTRWEANDETQDKIWVPSRREIFGNQVNSNTFDWLYYIGQQATYKHIPEQFETKGPTYSSAITKKVLDSMCTVFGTNSNNSPRLRSIGKEMPNKQYVSSGYTYIGNFYSWYTSSNPYSTNQYTKGTEGTYPAGDIPPNASWLFGFCL